MLPHIVGISYQNLIVKISLSILLTWSIKNFIFQPRLFYYFSTITFFQKTKFSANCRLFVIVGILFLKKQILINIFSIFINLYIYL